MRGGPTTCSKANKTATYLRIVSRREPCCLKPTTIYGLIDPRTQELRYVGKTVDGLRRRIAIHKKGALHAHAAGHRTWNANWLRTLYRDGLEPETEVFEIVPPSGDWVEAEQFWIAYFRAIGANLTNLTVGGEGIPGLKRDPSFGAHISKLQRGRKISEETKAKMRSAWTAERKEAHAALRRKPKKGKPTREETSKRLSEALKAAWARDPARKERYRHFAIERFTAEARKAAGLKRRGKPATPQQLKCLAIGWALKRDGRKVNEQH